MNEKKEYIEREAVFNALHDHEFQTFLPLDEVNDVIDDIPAADVVEVRHGEWITDNDGFVTCSECGEEHTWDDFRPTYCDMCGAKMDRERKERG